jgi:hypothetical protein
MTSVEPSAYDAVADHLIANLHEIAYSHLWKQGHNPPSDNAVVTLKREIRKIATELRQKGVESTERG